MRSRLLYSLILKDIRLIKCKRKLSLLNLLKKIFMQKLRNEFIIYRIDFLWDIELNVPVKILAKILKNLATIDPRKT